MSETTPATRIDTLHLCNYRGFPDTVIDLDPRLTVLVGRNGAGKTAVLDALAMLWAVALDALLVVEGRVTRSSREDVRKTGSPRLTRQLARWVSIQAEGSIAGTAATWRQHLLPSGETRDVPGPTSAALGDIFGELLRRLVEHDAGNHALDATLPLLARYGTARSWSARNVHSAKKPDDLVGRFSAYTDCLSPATTFSLFQRWLQDCSRAARGEGASPSAAPGGPLETVRVAIDKLLELTGWRQIEWDFAEDKLVASHAEHGRLPVHMLGDGIRSLIGLVGDIAHRCIVLNPHLGADALSATPGIVLIDEVTLHLHPEQQQTVIPVLREVFPALQLVVTTHSHLAVSTVPSRCIRMLGDRGSVLVPTLETEGYDSSLSLGVVFGVDPRPPVEIARQLTRYRMLIEQGQGDCEESTPLRRTLLAHFGERHPAMLEAEGLRRLHDFKTRLNRGSAA